MPFIVYVRMEGKPADMAEERSFPTMDEAANACIELTHQGYKICSVELPSGNCVTGEQIEWAIGLGAYGAGAYSVKKALTR